MGERNHNRDQPNDRPETSRRVTVREAADLLGITVEAVRNRIKRGTLTSEKEGDKERGTVYVILDGDHVPPGQPTSQPEAGRVRTSGQLPGQPEPADQPAELVDELRDRIAYLERQVEEEREARRRADTLMARLMDRVPEIEAPVAQEPRGARESAAEGEPGTNTPPDQASPQMAAQTGTQPRSWWRRLIGG